LVTTPSQVPNVMYRFGKLLDCMEFGQDHIIRASGSQASDSLTMTVVNVRLGN
jgi:hypothetical protein